METENVQELIEMALENAIQTLDLVATDDQLDQRLREAQRLCDNALFELRGYGHDITSDDWQNNGHND